MARKDVAIERIAAMEEALSDSRAAVDQLNEAVASVVDALDGLQRLSGYYGSADWYADREMDERGGLPAELERGVLSEDEPYEVLIGAREAALGALEVSTALLRAL